LFHQKLIPRDLKGINHFEIKLHHPESQHQPLRMNNISIQL
jgi:hypothetical protein